MFSVQTDFSTTPCGGGNLQTFVNDFDTIEDALAYVKKAMTYQFEFLRVLQCYVFPKVLPIEGVHY